MKSNFDIGYQLIVTQSLVPPNNFARMTISPATDLNPSMGMSDVKQVYVLASSRQDSERVI